MPTSGGPNTLGESNLVFAYDTGDTGNSYKGQPTVNVLPSSNALLTSYNDHGGTHITDTGFTLFGNATLRNISNPTQDWNGVYLTGLSSILTPGVTYTYSFYIYFTGDNTTISYFGYGAPGYTGVKGKWNRVSTTFTATTQDHFYVTLQYSNGQPVSTYYLANLQIEAKSYPTPFVNGTRSNTQGLLPLIGNSTIDLTNVSFDSNAKMIFDGTDDYVSITLPSSVDVYCLEMVWYNNNAIPNNDTAIGGPSTYQTPIEFNNNSTGVHLGAWTSGFTNEAIHIWSGGGATSNREYAGVGYHHVVFNWNGTTYDIWVDGVKTTIYYVNGTSPATLITASSIKLGGDVNDYNFYGEIPITKIYNRALTAQEIKQNYQQYKTRFNLS